MRLVDRDGAGAGVGVQDRKPRPKGASAALRRNRCARSRLRWGCPPPRMVPLPALASSEPCTPCSSMPPEPVSTRTEPGAVCCKVMRPLPVSASKAPAMSLASNRSAAGLGVHVAFYAINIDIAGAGFRVHPVADGGNLKASGAGADLKRTSNTLHSLIARAALHAQVGFRRDDHFVADGNVVPQFRVIDVADADVIAALLNGRVRLQPLDLLLGISLRTIPWPGCVPSPVPGWNCRCAPRRCPSPWSSPDAPARSPAKRAGTSLPRRLRRARRGDRSEPRWPCWSSPGREHGGNNVSAFHGFSRKLR